MLTFKENLAIHALWQRRVADGKYLRDVSPKNLRTGELCDLISSSFYSKEILKSVPNVSSSYEYISIRLNRCPILKDLVLTHRMNSKKAQDLTYM